MYYVFIECHSDGSDPSEYQIQFPTLQMAWDYIHLNDGYHEYVLRDIGPGLSRPERIPHNSQLESQYWDEYFCSHVSTQPFHGFDIINAR